MNNIITRILLLVPPLLFLIGSILGYVRVDGQTIQETRLLHSEAEMVATIFSNMSMFLLFAFLGVALSAVRQETAVSLGKMFYSLSFIFAYLMLMLHHQHHSASIQADGGQMAFSGYLLIIAVAAGLLSSLFIVFKDVVIEMLESTYGSRKPTESPGKPDTLTELKRWKEMLDQNQIDVEDYTNIKRKGLKEFTFDDSSTWDMLTKLKKATDDDIIDAEEFRNLKEKLLANMK